MPALFTRYHKTSAHTKIGLDNEDTRKLRNEVTLFSKGITISIRLTKTWTSKVPSIYLRRWIIHSLSTKSQKNGAEAIHAVSATSSCSYPRSLCISLTAILVFWWSFPYNFVVYSTMFPK
jgi:hypothetical protein